MKRIKVLSEFSGHKISQLPTLILQDKTKYLTQEVGFVQMKSGCQITKDLVNYLELYLVSRNEDIFQIIILNKVLKDENI